MKLLLTFGGDGDVGTELKLIQFNETEEIQASFDQELTEGTKYSQFISLKTKFCSFIFSNYVIMINNSFLNRKKFWSARNEDIEFTEEAFKKKSIFWERF